ncbi:MAG: hypothetical protein GOMPHAMPRED_007801 [Gomphillus americanus]|uniref:Uncharacterized protein n=1 Tax=Gomphillus americanus TaxID=1940652 RepID=A0A8H3EW68_9LECA|nr:MAG: hypothetical protein GOMPHAMPRED_007801 [Gomphillus americanus]
MPIEKGMKRMKSSIGDVSPPGIVSPFDIWSGGFLTKNGTSDPNNFDGLENKELGILIRGGVQCLQKLARSEILFIRALPRALRQMDKAHSRHGLSSTQRDSLSLNA